MSIKYKTLVIGGSGFIGSHFVGLLIKDKMRDIVVVGRSKKPKYNLPNEVEYISADVRDENSLHKLIAGCNEIVDLAYASVPKTSFDDPVVDILSNLPYAVNLFKLASESNIRRIMIVSSGGTVYGNPEYLPIKETHKTDPVSPYGITKLAIEKYAQLYHHLECLPVVIVRPSNPYGANQFGALNQGFIGASLYAALHKTKIQVFGQRGTIRDYIYINDLAEGLIAALNHGISGEIYNIGSGIGTDNIEVVTTLNNVIAGTGYQLSYEILPERTFDVEANVLSSKKLTNLSGWSCQTSLEDGLHRTWLSVAKVGIK
jgi:UDP-glucose 4-epimerase